MSQAAEAGHAGRCVPAGRPSGSRNRNTQPLTPGRAASGATHAPRPRRAQAEAGVISHPCHEEAA